ncbi:hypothetical protein AW40_12145 [Kosakonia radicincitans UMEnt01/12]|uniref:hypothetical protein n=1 Tax=Kosakonia radicincitans TaxID=283686 RepID=UPI000460BC78|nr:hypothetical protein [Kosakonia radicincitans]KDE36449.1 hypothetical protein AW40_12145 [Kosakonia radicincitans UMEnt01/12]
MKELAMTITHADLACLEHLRNIGQYVSEMVLLQDSTTTHRPPAQQLQLTSVIFLMTAQLDGVVERCNRHWLNEEVSA